MEDSLTGGNNKSRKFCSIRGCKQRGGRMYNFPKCEERRDQWRLACHLTKVTKGMNICPKHFSANDFVKTPKGYMYLKKGVIPSIFPQELESHSTRRCVVPQCGLSIKDEVSLHSFPRNLARRLVWQNVCGLTRVPNRRAKICCLHFIPNDFRCQDGKKALKFSAVPSLVLPGSATEVANHCNQSARYHDSEIGENSSSESMDISEAESSQNSDRLSGQNGSNECGEVSPNDVGSIQSCEFSVLCPEHSSKSVDYDNGSSLRPSLQISESATACPSSVVNSVRHALLESVVNGLDNMNNPLVESSSRNPGVKAEHSDFSKFMDGIQPGNIFSGNNRLVEPSSFNPGVKAERSDFNEFTRGIQRGSILSDVQDNSCQTDVLTLLQLVKNDSQLKALAGITFSLLSCLEKWATSLTNGQQNSELPLREKIVLTLVKLRLNLSFELLAILFGIDHRQCSAHFEHVLPLLSEVLKNVIYWPTLEEIRMNMPEYFSQFRDTRVVLDCIEIPVDSPDCLKCRMRLYSHCKECLTAKILVGVAPSGLIIFISPAYGGNASDEFIFQESILLKEGMLEPFVDAVMVDEEFRIDKVCEEKNIKIIRPPFVTKKQQLSENETLVNADIPNARVHVERAVQHLKIFQILKHKIGLNMLPHIDDIMCVIVAITNLSEPIIAEHRYLS